MFKSNNLEEILSYLSNTKEIELTDLEKKFLNTYCGKRKDFSDYDTEFISYFIDIIYSIKGMSDTYNISIPCTHKGLAIIGKWVDKLQKITDDNKAIVIEAIKEAYSKKGKLLCKYSLEMYLGNLMEAYSELNAIRSNPNIKRCKLDDSNIYFILRTSYDFFSLLYRLEDWKNLLLKEEGSSYTSELNFYLFIHNLENCNNFIDYSNLLYAFNKAYINTYDVEEIKYLGESYFDNTDDDFISENILKVISRKYSSIIDEVISEMNVALSEKKKYFIGGVLFIINDMYWKIHKNCKSLIRFTIKVLLDSKGNIEMKCSRNNMEKVILGWIKDFANYIKI